MEINREDNTSSILTTSSGPALPISLPRHHQHPSHDHPNTALVIALNPHLQLGVSAPQRDEEPVSQVAIEEDDSTTSPPTQDLSTGIPNVNSITQAVHSLRIEQAPPPIRSHSYSNPKQVAILVGACLPLYISVLVKVILNGHSHPVIVNLFMIISTIAYAMAFLDLCALFWLYERLGNSNSSHQNTYLCRYKILKDVNIVLCALVIVFTLLPLLIILIPHPHPQPYPPPHSHRHHH